MQHRSQDNLSYVSLLTLWKCNTKFHLNLHKLSITGNFSGSKHNLKTFLTAVLFQLPVSSKDKHGMIILNKGQGMRMHFYFQQ